MPVDIKTFSAQATRGDVAGVAIDCVIAFRAVVWALENLKAGRDISAQVEQVNESIDSLDKAFERLSGWTNE
jgi:hypothetical protein